MSRPRSKSIHTGRGEKCPKCFGQMERRAHPATWKPKAGQPYYFTFWDLCPTCQHLQHYEIAKVLIDTPDEPKPSASLTPLQRQAQKALCKRLPKATPKARRVWLADQMGIDVQYAVISRMDDVECGTVVDICEGNFVWESALKAAAR